MRGGARILYLSYDGMTDPLGATQVLPYLTGLSRLGHRITIVSCEKPSASPEQRRKVQALCEEFSLEWHPLRYHKYPPVLATIIDLAAMHRTAKALHRRHRFQIVHCRSYVPALVGLALKRSSRIRLLFDMRGFWADERLEGGNWPRSNPLFRLIYRYFKRKEKILIRESDAIVSLTESAKREMLAGHPHLDPARISMIPCCVDFERFDTATPEARASARAGIGIPADSAVLVYVGSLGGNYLLDEMLAFYRAFRAKHPNARFLLITRSDVAQVLDAAATQGISAEEIVVRSAEPDEVPQLASAADLAIAFKAAGFSSKACCPTKLGEMLALGLPAVVNAGVGDVEQVIEQTGAGIVVDSFDPKTLEDAAEAISIMTSDPQCIRAAAREIFELQDGVGSYDRIYRKLGEAELLAAGANSADPVRD